MALLLDTSLRPPWLMCVLLRRQRPRRRRRRRTVHSGMDSGQYANYISKRVAREYSSNGNDDGRWWRAEFPIPNRTDGLSWPRSFSRSASQSPRTILRSRVWGKLKTKRRSWKSKFTPPSAVSSSRVLRRQIECWMIVGKIRWNGDTATGV